MPGHTDAARCLEIRPWTEADGDGQGAGPQLQSRSACTRRSWLLAHRGPPSRGTRQVGRRSACRRRGRAPASRMSAGGSPSRCPSPCRCCPRRRPCACCRRRSLGTFSAGGSFAGSPVRTGPLDVVRRVDRTMRATLIETVTPHECTGLRGRRSESSTGSCSCRTGDVV